MTDKKKKPEIPSTDLAVQPGSLLLQLPIKNIQFSNRIITIENPTEENIREAMQTLILANNIYEELTGTPNNPVANDALTEELKSLKLSNQKATDFYTLVQELYPEAWVVLKAKMKEKYS